MVGWLLSTVAEGLSSGHDEGQKVIISAFLDRRVVQFALTFQKRGCLPSMSSVLPLGRGLNAA